jgi:hypothetical protein
LHGGTGWAQQGEQDKEYWDRFRALLKADQVGSLAAEVSREGVKLKQPQDDEQRLLLGTFLHRAYGPVALQDLADGKAISPKAKEGLLCAKTHLEQAQAAARAKKLEADLEGLKAVLRFVDAVLAEGELAEARVAKGSLTSDERQDVVRKALEASLKPGGAIHNRILTKLGPIEREFGDEFAKIARDANRVAVAYARIEQLERTLSTLLKVFESYKADENAETFRKKADAVARLFNELGLRPAPRAVPDKLPDQKASPYPATDTLTYLLKKSLAELTKVKAAVGKDLKAAEGAKLARLLQDVGRELLDWLLRTDTATALEVAQLLEQYRARESKRAAQEKAKEVGR